MKKPLEAAKLIGDKLIRETPFAYRLEVAKNNGVFDRMQFVDFGRTFGLGRPAVAFAWTRLTTEKPGKVKIQIEHNDGCKIWLNGREVYAQRGDRKLNLRRDERSFEMSGEFEVVLQRGANTLLIKSETRGSEWRVYLQPPSHKGAVVNGAVHPEIGLRGVPNVDEKIAELTNWLVIGPFENPQQNLDAAFAPEKEFVFGKMYPGLDAPVTWTIPKIEILGGLIDPLPWGTNYNWNYHNGGTAWAMQLLGRGDGRKEICGLRQPVLRFPSRGHSVRRASGKSAERGGVGESLDHRDAAAGFHARAVAAVHSPAAHGKAICKSSSL